ncbi:MAG TPA: OsmC family protein [Terrimicrobiaceae bacterium]
MNNLIPDKLKIVLERNAQALQLRPAIGKGTGKTTVRLRPGLKCEIEDGPWKLIAGASENSGGTAAGPDPGTFGRGALGSCLAMNYANWAAKLDVPIESIEVEVEGDYDVRGFYGLADLPPGYLEVRYRVKISSNEPEERVRKVLDEADAHCPWFDIFRRPQNLKRIVELAPADD